MLTLSMELADEDTEPDRRKSYAGLLPPSKEFPALVEENEENLTVRTWVLDWGPTKTH